MSLTEDIRPRPGPVARRTVVEVIDGQRRPRPDSIVTEEPLEIRLSWPGHQPSRVAVTMRTPGADFELATGYLVGDGVLGPTDRPSSVAYCIDKTLSAEQKYNVVTVDLGEVPRRHPSARSTTMTSACGVCGTESIDEVFTPDTAPMQITDRLRSDVIVSLPDALRAKQGLFAKTGSIHASGLFDFDGNLVVSREDVGRHNTVDKVVGARQLGTVNFGESSVLCVSGRIGFDIATKAVAARISVVVAVGGPSSLAVGLAERAGMTLCGFTRGNRFVVYSAPDRIAD